VELLCHGLLYRGVGLRWFALIWVALTRLRYFGSRISHQAHLHHVHSRFSAYDMHLPDLLRPPELPDDASSAARAMLRALVVMERSGLILLTIGFFGILIMATEARDRVRIGPPGPDYAFAPGSMIRINRADFPKGRYIYPYSVIPGGVQSPDELQTAVYTDPVVGQHYSDFDLSEVKFYTTEHDDMFYVSYRTPKGVFWTNYKVRVHLGERLLTDGISIARARCGNRLSTIPQLPISTSQPALAEMEFPGELIPPVPLAPVTPTVAIVHTPPTPFIFIPPLIFPPGGPGTPFVPPIFFASNPPAGAIVFFLSIVTWVFLRRRLRRPFASD